MRLRFIRSKKEMEDVLMKPESSGPDPVYTVYQDLDNGWVNSTTVSAGLYGKEYPKTYGHIHIDGFNEIYFVESGQGLFLIQNDKEFLIIKVSDKDQIVIPGDHIHAIVNTGETPLVLFDNHQNPKSDYEIVLKTHGLSYYVINSNGAPEAIPNPNYPNHPPVKWLTAEEFSTRT